MIDHATIVIFVVLGVSAARPIEEHVVPASCAQSSHEAPHYEVVSLNYH